MKRLSTIVLIIISSLILLSCSEYRSLRKISSQMGNSPAKYGNCECYDYGGLKNKRRTVNCGNTSSESRCSLGCGLNKSRYSTKNICRIY